MPSDVSVNIIQRIFTIRIVPVPMLLSLALLLSGLVMPCQAQRRVIVITSGQPNVWTLEQAHSLLEQMNLRVNSVVSTLFGSGSQQPKRLSQFAQQDLHSSGFVKGSHEFGWTFKPLQGMNRLQSGIRTTYAVIVVPDDAASLVLEANGCYFPRSARQPTSFEDTKTRAWNNNSRTSRNCSGEQTKTLIVPILPATTTTN